MPWHVLQPQVVVPCLHTAPVNAVTLQADLRCQVGGRCKASHPHVNSFRPFIFQYSFMTEMCLLLRYGTAAVLPLVAAPDANAEIARMAEVFAELAPLRQTSYAFASRVWS